MGWVLNATPEVEAISQWQTIIAIACVLSFLSVAVRPSRRRLDVPLSTAFALIYSGLTIARRGWNPLKDGTYLPLSLSLTAYVVVVIVFDVVIAVLLILVLLRLNIRVQKKASLIAIFLLGLFTTLCFILRYLEINRIQYSEKNSTILVMWGTIKFNVGNIVSSLPFLAPVFMKKVKNYRYKYSGGSSHGRSHLNGPEHYKLSEINHNKSVFASANHSKASNGSEENILLGNIIKSVTYSVQVDDRAEAKSGKSDITRPQKRDSRDSDL
ncbi:uncharacterized protein ColSpa_09830 [Colletotrichum spaethianum]|uniref:Rhodopsin domain-containing protein n=1 Tax=Colletotrichum spaethianum TaxID=700344 RepID=A0AA37UJH3_9PEZI|nr:uncharacterized protein ColSpa_09830 [Colletotrichum spaethianum]GKT49649.1 hypothetical protein ColSpa_09830 [Colletotrichum spaethianum]